MTNQRDLFKSLAPLGFDAEHYDSKLLMQYPLIGRITRQDRQRFSVMTADGLKRASLTQGQRFDKNRGTLPIVGDWVALAQTTKDDELHPIQTVLPRVSVLSRRASGDANLEQTLVANLDLIFVVSGLDQNFNINRIERFLAMAWSCGLPAVLLLSKVDQCTDVDTKLAQLKPILRGTPVYPVNMLDPSTLFQPLSHLSTGRCAAMIGSSGVGKSTMLNQLLGSNHMATQPVRAFDDKGRHTTTHRELCLLPDAKGLIIDTPGMREAQIWFQEARIQARYAELLRVEEQCRFSDCLHLDDPGCSVRAQAMRQKDTADLWQQYRRLIELHDAT